MSSIPLTPARPALALYAKLVVLAVFALILAGGQVTSSGAGMAAPDWPFTFGSLKPAGWWNDSMLRLEHGHRLIATYVGFLTAILAAAVWRNRILTWILSSVAGVHALYLAFGQTRDAVAPHGDSHFLASLIAAGVILWLGGLFALLLMKTSPVAVPGEKTVRTLALCALLGVCLQAILGGIRVTSQTAGDAHLALALRVFHGCVAQAFLCLLVTLAALLAERVRPPLAISARLRRFSWITVGVIFLQLIVGAAMRHYGAGLAIPTFPAAAPDGSLLPLYHNAPTDLNFTHTRVGALLVTLFIFYTAHAALRAGRGHPEIRRPAAGPLALLLVQLTLGVLVVLHTRPPTLATVHVVNGALLLATAVLLALRLSRAGKAPIPEAVAPLSTVSSQEVFV